MEIIQEFGREVRDGTNSFQSGLISFQIDSAVEYLAQLNPPGILVHR